MSINVRAKGQGGEREAAELLLRWITPVCIAYGAPIPDVERNLMQSRAGGFDLVGIPWLAVEVKRQEALQLSAWWKQAVKQAGPNQIPLLLWRQNRQPWRARVRMRSHHGVLGQPCGLATLDADLDASAVEAWVRTEMLWRLKAAGYERQPA